MIRTALTFLKPFWGKIVQFFIYLVLAVGAAKYVERSGSRKLENKILKDETKKEGKSRAVAQREKREVDRLSDSELVDRLRRRGDDWGGL